MASNLPPNMMTAHDGRIVGLPFPEFRWELCNGMLLVESYSTENVGEHRVRLTDRLSGESLTLRWEQWEDLKEAIDNRDPA